MSFNAENPLHAYAKWVAETPREWSQLALSRAQDALIDTIAVMIPGAAEPATKIVAKLASKWGTGDISTVGFKEGFSAPMAAMVGGTAAHALDFDDNFDPAKAHASAVLVPAILATAQSYERSGQDVLDAYIVGLQIMGLTGQGVNPYHRSRGWHATATVGAVGAAAACARLIGLNWEKTAHAISLSTSFAGGFMSQFGTMTKPLHAGMAAAGGLQAAQFAEYGLTAGSQTLHGDKGMGTLMVGPDVADLRKIMAGKDEHGQKVEFRTNSVGEPLHIEKYGLKVKRFPNCGSVHRALDGTLYLRSKYKVATENIDHILVRAPAAHLHNLMYERPTDSLQAKFSLEYGVAVGFLKGTAGLPDYTDEAVSDPGVLSLLPKVRKEYVEKLESDFPTEVHFYLKNGNHYQTSIAMPVGSSTNPLTREQLFEKFDACAKGHLPLDQSETIKSALAKMPEMTKIHDITTLLAF